MADRPLANDLAQAYLDIDCLAEEVQRLREVIARHRKPICTGYVEYDKDPGRQEGPADA